MGILLSFVYFMVLICVLVAAHELGHLLFARANGVSVEAFSIGYGPVICEKTDRRGTKWRFSLFPLGGYVKMFGDADATSVRERITNQIDEDAMQRMSIHRKKPWQKLIVSAGGPLANFMLAIIIITGLATLKGIPEYTNVINVVSEKSLAYESGLRNGDVITSANHHVIECFNDIRREIKNSAGKELSIETADGRKIHFKMLDKNGKAVSALGITPTGLNYKKLSFLNAIQTACVTTYTIAYENMRGILQILTSRGSTKDVGGIISIFKMSSDSAESGVALFVWMLAFLSIVLGTINLLPIPVLDGGAILISGVEWMIGRPLNKKFIDIIFMCGLAIVVGLMFLGLWNDLEKCNFFIRLKGIFQ